MNRVYAVIWENDRMHNVIRLYNEKKDAQKWIKKHGDSGHKVERWSVH